MPSGEPARRVLIPDVTSRTPATVVVDPRVRHGPSAPRVHSLGEMSEFPWASARLLPALLTVVRHCLHSWRGTDGEAVRSHLHRDDCGVDGGGARRRTSAVRPGRGHHDHAVHGAAPDGGRGRSRWCRRPLLRRAGQRRLRRRPLRPVTRRGCRAEPAHRHCHDHGSGDRRSGVVLSRPARPRGQRCLGGRRACRLRPRRRRATHHACGGDRRRHRVHRGGELCRSTDTAARRDDRRHRLADGRRRHLGDR